MNDRTEARTLGFYQLKNTVRTLSSPINTFLFSTNANAPRMLDEDLPFLAYDDDFIMEIRDKVAITGTSDGSLTWA